MERLPAARRPGPGGPGEQESLAIVDEALRLGVNLFDPAPGYGSGRSEELVGRALEGRREELESSGFPW